MKTEFRLLYNGLRRYVRRRTHAVAMRVNRRPVVAHHGIQRSGTNYLCALLEQADYFVVNRVDPVRSAPSHKHCRWQDDKTTIVMSSTFANDHRASSAEDVNRTAGFPSGTRHVVVFKNPAVWLESIYRWGLTHSWVDSTDDFVGSAEFARAWLREWSHYYEKWSSIGENSPGSVLMIGYDDLQTDPVATMSRVNQFLGRRDAAVLPRGGRMPKVPHSGRRSRAADRPEVDPAFERMADEVVGFDWRARCTSGASGDAA